MTPLFPPGVRAFLLVAMVLLGGVLLFEWWRRGARPGSLAPEQFRRRVAGVLALEADLLLWLLADLILPRLSAPGKILYLLTGLLLLVVPMYLAVREIGFILRDYARGRAALYRGLAKRPDHRGNGAGGANGGE